MEEKSFDLSKNNFYQVSIVDLFSDCDIFFGYTSNKSCSSFIGNKRTIVSLEISGNRCIVTCSRRTMYTLV